MIKIIGICGGSASGKTAVSKKLEKNNPSKIVVISQDSYYNPYSELSLEERKNINYDHPNAFDIELLKEHLLQLKKGGIIQMPVYSFSEYTRLDKTIYIQPKDIIILEGMLISYYPEIRELLDKSFYIDATERTRLKRMVMRDVRERGRTVESVLEQYKRDMKPMYDQYVEPLKQFADIIIDGNLEQYEVYNNIVKNLTKSHILDDGLER